MIREIVHDVIDEKLPGRSDRIFNLPTQEREKECGYWMLQDLDDMRWRPEPTAPIEIQEYREKKRDNPYYRVNNDFWMLLPIKAWAAESNRIEGVNRGNHYWLLQLKKMIPEEDIVSQRKIDAMLRTYPRPY